jgi:hypothetical protein
VQNKAAHAWLRKSRFAAQRTGGAADDYTMLNLKREEKFKAIMCFAIQRITRQFDRNTWT